MLFIAAVGQQRASKHGDKFSDENIIQLSRNLDFSQVFSSDLWAV